MRLVCQSGNRACALPAEPVPDATAASNRAVRRRTCSELSVTLRVATTPCRPGRRRPRSCGHRRLMPPPIPCSNIDMARFAARPCPRLPNHFPQRRGLASVFPNAGPAFARDTSLARRMSAQPARAGMLSTPSVRRRWHPGRPFRCRRLSGSLIRATRSNDLGMTAS